MTSWANRGKAATAAVPVSKTAPAIDRGVRHEGTLDKAELTQFSTGSIGVVFRYVVEGWDKAVYENVVLFKQTLEGTMTATKYGDQTLRRRFQAFGLTPDDINSFTTPKTIGDKKAADFITNLPLGAPVAVYLIDEEYMGKAKKAVKSVFPLEG